MYTNTCILIHIQYMYTNTCTFNTYTRDVSNFNPLSIDVYTNYIITNIIMLLYQKYSLITRVLTLVVH